MKLTRRKALAGIGIGALAGGAVFGSGAFSSVEADRDLTVEVADDAVAFLALEPADEYPDDNPDSANAEEFVTEATGDAGNTIIELDVTETDAGGQGINDDATTVIRDMLTITNNGTDSVIPYVDLEASSGLSEGDFIIFHDDTDYDEASENQVGDVYDGRGYGDPDDFGGLNINVIAEKNFPVLETEDRLNRVGLGFGFTGLDDISGTLVIGAATIDELEDFNDEWDEP